jgi:hypothetical protein
MIKVVNDKSEGLVSFLGTRITMFGLNYIYTGNLVAVDKTWAKLEDAGIVYETGSFTEKEWKDCQKLPHPIYVKLASIESITTLK